MMKKLLTAVFAVAALVLVTPSAEARRCGKKCAPKRCEVEAPRCEAPQCETEVVDYKLYPCCRTRTYVENGYKKCPVEKTCCTRVRCCPEKMSCCYFPGQEGFNQTEADSAHNGSVKPSMEKTVADDIKE